MKFSVFQKSYSRNPFSELQLSDYASIVIDPEKGGGIFTEGADLVKRIRATNEVDIQRKLKQKLPAISPGAQFGLDRQHVSCFTGLMQIDIDDGIKDPEGLRNALGQLSWVPFSSLSVRRGVYLLVWIPEPDRQPEYWEKVNIWLQATYQLSADPARKNPKDLRFFASDNGAIYNPQATILNTIPPEPTQLKKVVSYHNRNTTSAHGLISPFQDFNNKADVISMLLNDGWKLGQKKGSKIRLTRPGKNHGTSADWDENIRRLYLFTSNSNLTMDGKGHALSPVDIFMQLHKINTTHEVRKLLTDLGYGNSK